MVGNDGAAGSVAHNIKLNDVLPGNGGLVWQTATASPQRTCSISPFSVANDRIGNTWLEGKPLDSKAGKQSPLTTSTFGK